MDTIFAQYGWGLETFLNLPCYFSDLILERIADRLGAKDHKGKQDVKSEKEEKGLSAQDRFNAFRKLGIRCVVKR